MIADRQFCPSLGRLRKPAERPRPRVALLGLLLSGTHGGAIVSDEQRAKRIDAILRLQYPMAFITLPSSLTRTLTDWKPRESIEAPPDDSRYMAARADAEAARAKLEQLADEELQRRHQEVITAARQASEERARKAAQDAESQRLYNTPIADADLEHWAQMSHWKWEEFLALSFGKNPAIVTPAAVTAEASKHQRISSFPSPFAALYFKRHEIFKRAVSDASLPKAAASGAYLAWSERRNIEVPAKLVELVKASGVVIADWQTMAQQYKKLYETWKDIGDSRQAALDQMISLHKQSNEQFDKQRQIIATLAERLERAEAGPRLVELGESSQQQIAMKGWAPWKRLLTEKLDEALVIQSSSGPAAVADFLAKVGACQGITRGKNDDEALWYKDEDDSPKSVSKKTISNNLSALKKMIGG